MIQQTDNRRSRKSTSTKQTFFDFADLETEKENNEKTRGNVLGYQPRKIE